MMIPQLILLPCVGMDVERGREGGDDGEGDEVEWDGEGPDGHGCEIGGLREAGSGTTSQGCTED